MKKSLILILLLLCPLTFGQNSTFSGPGVLSRSGGVGQRSGQDVDLRYFVNATGVYDTGITPYAVTSAGTLLQTGGLFGVEAGFGGYGRHTFRRSALGLDYTGNFRHYTEASSFDGSNQQLNLEYTLQKSRRLTFDFNQSAGIQNYGTAITPVSGVADPIVDTSSLLFDNRTSYLQTSLTANYALTGRTTISMGGSYYAVHRESSALVGVKGYNLQGGIAHRLSRSTIIGASYQHTHFDFPRAFGESDINLYTGRWSTTFGRSWDITLSGGAFTAAVQGVRNTALDPGIAELLGISAIRTIFYQESLMPTGTIGLTKRFRRASWYTTFGRTVTPGNGVYLTSVQETFASSYSYTGFRRWSLSVNAGLNRLNSIGQELQEYTQLSESGTVTYNLGRGFNLTGIYARRHQDLQTSSFPQNSSRVSIGIYFSPGEIPISFH